MTKPVLIPPAVSNLAVAQLFEWQRAIAGNNIERFREHAGHANPRFRGLANLPRTSLPTDPVEKTYAEQTQLFPENVLAAYLYRWILTTVARRGVRGLDRSPNPEGLTWRVD